MGRVSECTGERHTHTQQDTQDILRDTQGTYSLEDMSALFFLIAISTELEPPGEPEVVGEGDQCVYV